ncbi:MAG: hypothetical protein BA874_12755 [Desulfuromonadales bacterium C00003068]|nr:MAG: hypothetical protein BA874_12755 [Desulfuromonadales bacterium C00003068]
MIKKIAMVSIFSLLSVCSSYAQEAILVLECKGNFDIVRGSSSNPQELSYEAYDVFYIGDYTYSTDSGDSKFILADDGTVLMDSDTLYLKDGDGLVHTISRITGRFKFNDDYLSDISMAVTGSNIVCSTLERKF